MRYVCFHSNLVRLGGILVCTSCGMRRRWIPQFRRWGVWHHPYRVRGDIFR